MNYPNEVSNHPQVVGFESSPMPADNTETIRKYGLIGLGAMIVAWFLFMPTIKTPDSQAKTQNAKYVAPQQPGTSFRSADEAMKSVQSRLDEQMEKNRRMFDSINHR